MLACHSGCCKWHGPPIKTTREITSMHAQTESAPGGFGPTNTFAARRYKMSGENTINSAAPLSGPQIGVCGELLPLGDGGVALCVAGCLCISRPVFVDTLKFAITKARPAGDCTTESASTYLVSGTCLESSRTSGTGACLCRSRHLA